MSHDVPLSIILTLFGDGNHNVPPQTKLACQNKQYKLATKLFIMKKNENQTQISRSRTIITTRRP